MREDREEIERLADQAGVSLAEALREGAREWLLDRQPVSQQPVEHHGYACGCRRCSPERYLR